MLWNATSLINKANELNYFIDKNNIDIALITETWLNIQTKLNFLNYEIIRSDSTRNKAGGVAIIINKQIKFHTVAQVNIAGCDLLLIKLLSNINITVGVIYIPPKAKFSFDSLNTVLTKYAPIIIGGDYNAKHRNWNNFNNNARGIKLYKYINNSDISLIHSSTYTYRAPRKNASNIDIYLAKNIYYNYTCNTLFDMSSHHFPVILKFENVNIVRNELIVTKTDWEKFYNKTDKWRIEHGLENENSIDDCIQNLQTHILGSFKRSSTYQHIKKNTVIGEVDQADINKLIRLRNYYRRKYQRNGNNRFRLFRNVLNNLIRNTLKEYRNNYWAAKLKILNTKNNSLWYTLKSLSRKKNIPPPLILANQDIIYDPQQKAQIIAQNFHLVYSQAASLTSPFNQVVNDYIMKLEQNNNMIPPLNINFITPYVILNIIKTLPNKAPGQDKITAIILKNCSFKIVLQLYYIIKTSIKLGYFPKIWKTALVLAFPKPGKPPTSPANYRPISLLSVCSKIYEKIIHIQLVRYLESNKIIINEQFGFRPRHSTIAQLMRITENFAFEINKRRHSAMILLDLQKAFDSVWHRGLLYKLHLIGVPDGLISVIHSYLTDRSFITNFCGKKSTAFSVDAGVPQGSVLGPILFNIYINDIPKSNNSELAVYADDTAVFSSSWSIALLVRRLQIYVDDILQYFADWRMTINSEKTEAIIFTRRRYNPPPSITILNYPVPWSNRVKYLGVILDSSLRWGPAVNDRVNKTAAAFRILYPYATCKF